MSDISRCEVTRNPCGTDTWCAGYVCKCANCTKYLSELDDKLRAFNQTLFSAQEELGEPFSSVLAAELENLYES